MAQYDARPNFTDKNPFKDQEHTRSHFESQCGNGEQMFSVSRQSNFSKHTAFSITKKASIKEFWHKTSTYIKLDGGSQEFLLPSRGEIKLRKTETHQNFPQTLEAFAKKNKSFLLEL